ncbi:MAG: hypothetical protein RIB80_12030 [Rhodospirillales bacterium]
MLDSTMFFRVKNRHGFTVLLLAAFVISALFGSLAHANITEDFLTISQDQRSAPPVDQYEIDHGHSHDTDWPEERDQQHSHKHNPIDHSHEIPGITVFPLGALGNDMGGAYLAVYEQRHGYAPDCIDRPPRR